MFFLTCLNFILSKGNSPLHARMALSSKRPGLEPCTETLRQHVYLAMDVFNSDTLSSSLPLKVGDMDCPLDISVLTVFESAISVQRSSSCFSAAFTITTSCGLFLPAPQSTRWPSCLHVSLRTRHRTSFWTEVSTASVEGTPIKERARKTDTRLLFHTNVTWKKNKNTHRKKWVIILEHEGLMSVPVRVCVWLSYLPI